MTRSLTPALPIPVLLLFVACGSGVRHAPSTHDSGSALNAATHATASISVHVRASTGEPLPGALVTLFDCSPSVPSRPVQAVTNQDGVAVITTAPGTFTLRVHLQGFPTRFQRLVANTGEVISRSLELPLIVDPSDHWIPEHATPTPTPNPCVNP